MTVCDISSKNVGIPKEFDLLLSGKNKLFESYIIYSFTWRNTKSNDKLFVPNSNCYGGLWLPSI